MQLKIVSPKGFLSNYIASIIYYSGYTSESKYEALLPDGKSQLIMPLDDTPRAVYRNGVKQNLKYSWFTGIQTKPLIYLGERNASTFCVQFTEMGFFSLLRIPLIELLDEVIDADSILGSAISSLRDELIATKDLDGKISKIEKFFVTLFQSDPEKAPIVQFVLNELRMNDMTLERISQKSGYSQKQLIAIFKNHIGITPKRYQRLARFNQFLRTLQGDDSGGRSRDSLELSYCDQAHLIHEFRQFSHLSPLAYKKMRRPYPHVISLNVKRLEK